MPKLAIVLFILALCHHQSMSKNDNEMRLETPEEVALIKSEKRLYDLAYALYITSDEYLTGLEESLCPQYQCEDLAPHARQHRSLLVATALRSFHILLNVIKYHDVERTDSPLGDHTREWIFDRLDGVYQFINNHLGEQLYEAVEGDVNSLPLGIVIDDDGIGYEAPWPADSILGSWAKAVDALKQKLKASIHEDFQALMSEPQLEILYQHCGVPEVLHKRVTSNVSIKFLILCATFHKVMQNWYRNVYELMNADKDQPRYSSKDIEILHQEAMLKALDGISRHARMLRHIEVTIESRGDAESASRNMNDPAFTRITDQMIEDSSLQPKPVVNIAELGTRMEEPNREVVYRNNYDMGEFDFLANRRFPGYVDYRSDGGNDALSDGGWDSLNGQASDDYAGSVGGSDDEELDRLREQFLINSRLSEWQTFDVVNSETINYGSSAAPSQFCSGASSSENVAGPSVASGDRTSVAALPPAIRGKDKGKSIAF
ncbi:hypothetical protein SeLEV6574_g03275 [Synchytrium endobioticum]|uniref:Uncharacterized protein n=2 Tax=Synchytrium endobioticum TaxID=286115 RepID=A0A507D4D1_9FUNG|nr:hypothetical protein SeLEV6574_g03275 [Synchytrium endobioticum]